MSAIEPKAYSEPTLNAENASGQTDEPAQKRAKKESDEGLSQAPRDKEEKGKFITVRSIFTEEMARESRPPRSLPLE